jgi:hypothetical protein
LIWLKPADLALSRITGMKRRTMLITLGSLLGLPLAAWPQEGAAALALAYRAQVDSRLDVPKAEQQRYSRLAEEAMARAAAAGTAQYVVVVDRNPWVQALLLFWRSAEGEWALVGASPVSTGRPGSFDHFETPVGVFEHSLANPDFRSEGTPNAEGIRGYGAKGLRVFDFGWQQVPRGWGDGAVSQMRLQMHATDPDLLERRLGSAQSKGCIRIPAALNRFIDRHGVLDADYESARLSGRQLWILEGDRQPVADAGRYLVVVDSRREDRPEWSPAPFIPHRRIPAPAPAPAVR